MGNDDTNEDIVYVLGYTSDNIFSGNFVANSGGVADGFDNLYPIGEGAGYAGGIMSAAIDGAHVEYYRGIRNPIGLKVGPAMTAEWLTELIEALDPDMQPLDALRTYLRIANEAVLVFDADVAGSAAAERSPRG